MHKLNLTLLIIMAVTGVICLVYFGVIAVIPESELYYRAPLPPSLADTPAGRTMYPHTWFLTFTEIAGTSLVFFVVAFILFKLINIRHEQNTVPSRERS